MEIMEIDPTTITSASSPITINKRGLKFTGDLTTEVSANKLTWVKGDTIVELGTHVPQLLKHFITDIDDQTIEGVKTFVSSPVVPTPSSNTDAANKSYVDGVAIAGAPDASQTVKGVVKLSLNPVSATEPIAVGDNDARIPTTGENNALVGNNTDIAVGTGNKFITQTGLQKSEESYAASTTGNDTYAITLSPIPTSYVNGMIVKFKPDTANTGAATLNVNSLGAITIKKSYNQDLETGDIEANQLVVVVYNSTGPVFEMVSQSALSKTTDIQIFTSDGSWTKPAGAKSILVQAWGAGGSGGKGDNANGGGGGGGEYRETWLNANDISSPVTVTVGTGGTAKSSAGAGNNGENSTFGTYASANGGIGGGSAAAADVAGGNGGNLYATVNGLYGAGVIAAVGQSGLYSGAGGGTNNGGGLNYAGGNSYYGGAGGGGSRLTQSGAAGGTSTHGGNGGAGGRDTNATAGSVPGGGGGGNSGTGNSGAGGDGKIIVTTFF
jgi:hypothetical protein